MAHAPLNFSAVIITGGSSGIGEAFIRSMTNLASNLLICNLSRSIPENFSNNPQVVHFPCDLGDSAAIPQVVEAVLNEIKARAPNGPLLLINNSGFGSYDCFQDLPLDHELAMIDVNIRGLVALTGYFLPSLIKRGGGIINIASTAAFQPTPYLSTYGATKAFVLHWTLSLSEDLAETAVRTLCVCPGPTSTNFHKRAGFTKPVLPKGTKQTANDVVTATWSAWNKRKRLVVCGLRNKILAAIASRLPKVLAVKLSGCILKRIRFNAKKT